METQNDFHKVPSSGDMLPHDTIFSDIIDTTKLEKDLRNARIWLYVIAAIQTAIGIFEYVSIEEKEVATIAGLIDVGIAFAFFVLALWSRKQALAAFSIAVAMYVIISIVSMVIDPSNVSGFAVLKILVVVALIKAIKSANEIRKLKESVGTD